MCGEGGGRERQGGGEGCVSASVLSYLNGQCDLGLLNKTYIVLVPKVKGPNFHGVQTDKSV